MPFFSLASFLDKKVTYDFRLFVFLFFFRLSFFYFSYLFAAVISLLPGLFSIQNILRKHRQDERFLQIMEYTGVVARNFAPSFSLKFLTIFVHISGSVKLINKNWVSLERPFLPAEVEYR